MPELLDSLPDLTSGSPWLLLLIPTFAFLEACFVIGVFVSGIFLLTIATVLYSTGYYPIWQIVLPALCGALVADHLGYFIGRYLGPGIWGSRFMQRHEKSARKIEAFLITSAPLAICAGRLTPAARSITPALAGVAGMKRSHFHACDLLACSLWATGLALLATGLSNLPF